VPQGAELRHYGGSASKDQQCWRSPIRRPRDESLGGIKHDGSVDFSIAAGAVWEDLKLGMEHITRRD
jgi:hypothetical protein